jgi:hypothetical protein
VRSLPRKFPGGGEAIASHPRKECMTPLGNPPSLEGVVGLGDAEVFLVNVPLGEGAE